MTPQILLNMLNSVIETERVYFADFTLVIFDECHHCDKGHPYKLLMDQLAELDNTKNGKRRQIQIVGLTASLGVGDTSWDMAECQRHMLSLCANLKAETISSVRQQLENLKEYVTPPVDHVVKVNRPVNNGFVEAIKRCMGEIQRSMQVELQSIVEQRKLPYIANDDILFPNVDDQFQYQTRVGLLKKYLQRLDEPVTRVLLLCSINHLSHYFYAITISDLLPNSFALDYLNKKMAEYTKRSDDDQFNQINANLLKRQSDNDQFNRINAILLKRYKDNDQFKLINATLLKRYNELLQQLREIERLESEEKEQNKRTLLSTGCINKYLFNMEKKEILNRLYRILFEQFAKKSDSRALIFVATRLSTKQNYDILSTRRKERTIWGLTQRGDFVCPRGVRLGKDKIGYYRRESAQRLDEPVTRVLLLCSINHLSHYFYAITISDLLPNSFALDYLNKKMAEYTKRSDDDQFNQINANLLKRQSDNDQFNRINAILLKRYKDNDQFKLINAILLKRYNELLQQLREIERLESEEKEQNKRTLLSTGCINKYLFNMEKKEILNRLYRILFEQFAKKSDSRALIFVATRACAQRLAKHLMELDLELPMFYNQNNVGHMVSANASGTMGGQSSDEQRRMREGFSVGLIKVLVVTSVAEEGVNIAACNLIIKYNNVGNERQMIQRRGRARHKDSKSILLALNTGAEQRELCNMRKEAMMMRCIADLQEQEEQTLLKQIEEKTEEMKVNRDEEKKKLENIRDQLMGKRFDLKCTCGTLISCSDRVRSVMGGSLYVCCDPEVWKRSKHTLSHISRRRKFTNLIRWECAKCGELWGHIVKFSNVFLPELRVRSFVLERLDQQRQFDRSEQVGKKWKDIEQNNFNVDAISIADIRSMYEGLLETNPEAHKEYEKQSRHQLAEIEWRHKEQRECALLDE
uniref:RNA helicase n=1 Tax=Globodera pallida TaxID=36090 RepID=A0A183BV17_GLOPA